MSSKQPQTQEFLGDRAAIVSALRNRNFRALWVGQLISQIGDNFLIVAIIFVINALTNSPLAIGIMALVITLPQLFLGLIGGVFVDRLDRKLVMIVSDIVRGLTVLALLFVQRADQLYILYIVGLVMTTVGLFANPARNAVIPNIVSGETLLTANALMQASQIISVILGASIAGLIVGWLGLTFAVVFDSLSFAVSAVAIATMTIPPVNPKPTKGQKPGHLESTGGGAAFHQTQLPASPCYDHHGCSYSGLRSHYGFGDNIFRRNTGYGCRRVRFPLRISGVGGSDWRGVDRPLCF